MINKILIANRGEIAVRIAKTCKKMNIKVACIYSKQDEDAYHLNYADEIYYLGEDPLKGSYLNQRKILDIVKKSNSDAVHPGYGFLSENYKFAKLLESNKKIFIGPPASAIKLMGDKITSKKLAKKAGVNCIPGINEVINNDKIALKISKSIGYPIMIKASAGGGGKGMRIAYTDKELISYINSAKNEAKNAFGDDRIFLEKYIENPRHIEIQILGDQFGNIIWLGDRECSIQIRHQKIIEEAPSSFIDNQLRKEMGKQSISLAKAVGYFSAGTVEYVVNDKKDFYFLEMNTRLQVEHPVTEETTGYDLVEEMINIANKKKLKIKQSEIKIKGWSFESRVCAENPLKNFMPSAGKIKFLKFPKDDIRLESGYREGEEVSIYYDPLIAKIISKGKDRYEAIDKMLKALEQIYIDGIDTNINFLMDIYRSNNFKIGKFDTNFIEKYYDDGYSGNIREDKDFLIINLLALAHKLTYLNEINANKINIKNTFISEVDGNASKIEALKIKENKYKIRFKNKTLLIYIKKIEESPIFLIIFEENKYYGLVKSIQEKLNISYRGVNKNVIILKLSSYNNSKKIPIKKQKNKEKKLIAPMPGRVVKVLVKVGQKVDAGQLLLILDAMKMENTINATEQGTIKKILVNNDETVIAEQDLIILS